MKFILGEVLQKFPASILKKKHFLSKNIFSEQKLSN